MGIKRLLVYTHVIFLLFVASNTGEAGFKDFLARFNLSSPAAFVNDCREKLQRLTGRVRWNLVANVSSSPIELIEKQVEYLKRYRKRDLNKTAEVVEYLHQHPVYVSVTTSPQRIKYLATLLKTIDAEQVEAIVVSIAKKFGRDQSEYEIPEELREFPKVVILESEVDIGPAMKLIPTVEWVKKRNPKGLVITIDDDTGYPRSVINDLIMGSFIAPRAVVGTVVTRFSYFGIQHKGAVSEEAKSLKFQDVRLVASDIVEGYSGILYPVELIDTAVIKEVLNLAVECKTSDDLVFSLFLEKEKIPRYMVLSGYLNRNQLIQFSYGFKEDALHLGGGLTMPNSQGNINNLKYQKAYNLIMK